ncbi:sensor histidine kinase [uncultured Dokdonia sp.]|uniref:sensor histidine kinase n=1 Tax=uncultured Dokdonia sp. TaxID=575653 RepID=UPI00260A27BA|nr:sensor histidine kinase [uncultured Dokdonia sp.]
MQPFNFKTFIKKNNYHRPLLFNGVLWLLAFVILLFIFSKGKTPIKVDYLYTFVFLLFMVIPVTINFYILIPRFLQLEKYSTYFIVFICNLLFFSTICIFFFQSLLDYLFSDFFFVSYVSITNGYTIFSIFLITTTLLKLAEDWFYFNTNENRILKLENQHIQTQLSSLRSQINPHFLFNSLNVIYAMALEKEENITKAIVELSDVLRYVIYDANTERVTLKEEIHLLQNYIAFQEYRTHTAHIVNLKVDVQDESFKIYPMLLLPLLENSYKYGILDTNTSGSIQIVLFQSGNQFKFIIQNTINTSIKNNLDDAYSGVGIENLKNNLLLVYPEQHQFIVENTLDTFKVTIEITDEDL